MDKILVDPITGSKNFMLLWSKLESGSGTELHTHSAEQAYFILRGRLQVRILGEEYNVGRGSAVYIPAGAEHSVTAEGKEAAVYVEVFAPPVEGYADKPH